MKENKKEKYGNKKKSGMGLDLAFLWISVFLIYIAGIFWLTNNSAEGFNWVMVLLNSLIPFAIVYSFIVIKRSKK